MKLTQLLERLEYEVVQGDDQITRWSQAVII